MSRARTTEDVFNAVGDLGRRVILDLLVVQEMTVTDVSQWVGMTQPQTSKHLRVLRGVGAVRVRENGRHRYYRADAEALRPIQAWSTALLTTWEARFDRLEAVASNQPARHMRT